MKNCSACNACKRLYRGYWYSYCWNKLFYCTLHKHITQPQSGCVHWQRRRHEYDLSPQRFDEVEQDIKFLLDKFQDSETF